MYLFIYLCNYLFIYIHTHFKKKVQRADLRRILQLKLAVWSMVGHLVKARKELEPSAELDMVCANQSMTVSATDKETSDE